MLQNLETMIISPPTSLISPKVAQKRGRPTTQGTPAKGAAKANARHSRKRARTSSVATAAAKATAAEESEDSSEGDEASEDGVEMELSPQLLQMMLGGGGGSDQDAWAETVGNTMNAVVELRFFYPRNFGTNTDAGGSAATGFVVSTGRAATKTKPGALGIIMTNLHVTGFGPFHMRGIFDSAEQVSGVVVVSAVDFVFFESRWESLGRLGRRFGSTKASFLSRLTDKKILCQFPVTGPREEKRLYARFKMLLFVVVVVLL